MFEITITEVKEVREREMGDWTVIEKRPMTEAELVHSCLRFQEMVKTEDLIKSVYGRTPAQEVTRKKELVIYKQSVEELDLRSVILALNPETIRVPVPDYIEKLRPAEDF